MPWPARLPFRDRLWPHARPCPRHPANPRKFQARFDVIYDSNHVTMRLKDSLGLNQGPCPGNPGVACIHPNVPRWMKNHLADVENLLR